MDRRPRGSGDPVSLLATLVPACAAMTNLRCISTNSLFRANVLALRRCAGYPSVPEINSLNARIGPDRGGRSVGDDPAAIEDDHARGKTEHDIDIVLGKERGDAAVTHQRRDELHDRAAIARRGSRGRLVA